MGLFTTRENCILHLVAQGFTNNEIAGKLSISTSTVRKHLDSIFKKLDVNNRVQAAIKSILYNYIDPKELIDTY